MDPPGTGLSHSVYPVTGPRSDPLVSICHVHRHKNAHKSLDSQIPQSFQQLAWTTEFLQQLIFRPSGLSCIWPRCVVALISSSQASLSYLHGNPASVNDHILTCAPTKCARTLVSVITGTPDPQGTMTCGPHFRPWQLELCMSSPISRTAGTPDTVSLMTRGALSSCWHLDPSLPPVSTIAPITCGLTPVVRP